MGRLTTLKSRLNTLPARVSTHRTADTRITGRTLQARRKRCWLRAEARCEECGRVVAYPEGFELDHVVPLYKGGPDTDENCQVLCNGPEGCHEAKTREDMRA